MLRRAGLLWYTRAMKNKPVTAIIVGAGHRSVLYAGLAHARPDMLKITGVADPNPLRREKVAREFSVGADMCFASAQELAKHPKLADAIINGTMDHQHAETSIPLLERGYDMLLEKPFTVSEEEMRRIAEAAKKGGNKVMICHVLRYAPFYAAIRKKLMEGAIGGVFNMQAAEHVSYHHMAVGYVRGKWNNTEKCRSGMLLAKCCHDMDLIMWMKTGVRPVSVSSFGSNYQFTPEKRPENAGTRCLVDCPIESGCAYSANKHHIENDWWGFYAWEGIEHLGDATREQRIESLKTGNPFGRCVWRCDNNVVDHQSVMVNFEDGCTATLNMVGGCAKPDRTLHIIGTKGEISGSLESAKFTLRKVDPRPGGQQYSEEVVDLNAAGDASGITGGHGGGDMRLVEDFVCHLRGEKPSISCTTLADSINGHLAVFRAEKSRETGATVLLGDF